MTWTQIALLLAALISKGNVPAQCMTSDAEQFAIKMTYAEVGHQSQLAHELAMGNFIVHRCTQDANWYTSYKAALYAQSIYQYRIFFENGIPSDVYAYLSALWQQTIHSQHYAIAHFGNYVPRAYCSNDVMTIGDLQYC